MAVVISSQFYQASLWKNISKIVFTSPNMDSPAIAGTRSHILPGEGDLATWYEDTANMYRIEDNQWETNSDFFNYRMKCKDTIEILDHSGYIDVKETNYSSLDTFIKENSGVEVIGYADNTSYITNTKPRLEYTLTQLNLDEIYNDTTIRVRETVERRESTDPNPGSTTQTRAYYTLTFDRSVGACVSVISGIELRLVMDCGSQKSVNRITASSIYVADQELFQIPVDTLFNNPIPTGTTTHLGTTHIFFGNYSIQGSYDQVIWNDIYTGANTINLTLDVTFNENVSYRFFRLIISNNTSLDSNSFNTNFYGIRYLKLFYDTLLIPALVLTPSSINLSSNSGADVIAVSNSGAGTINWTASVITGSEWLTISSGTSGSNSGNIYFTYQLNSGVSRYGSIKVNNTNVIVTQEGLITQPILSVNSTDFSEPSNSGNGIIVVSNAGAGSMNWTSQVTLGESWVSIASGSSGTDSGNITFSFTYNPTDSVRTATIHVSAPTSSNNSIDVYIVQEAGIDVSSWWSVTPSNNLNIDSTGADNHVHANFVITNERTGTMIHTESVITGSIWISTYKYVFPESPFTNGGTVSFACVNNNTGVTRVGTVRIAVSWNGITGIGYKDLTITQPPALAIEQPESLLYSIPILQTMTPIIFSLPGAISYSTITINGSMIISDSADRERQIIETKTLTGTVYNIPKTLIYYVYTLDRTKGWYTPVNIDVPPYIIFTFPDATKITAMYMSSVQVNQELWQIPLATLFNTPTPAATTTLTPKNYFIGNFNVQGSNDQITWTTIYTGANTTKPTKTAYFSNTQYYKYYKLNILNNTGLSTTAGTPPVVNTIFDVDYYGIKSLKFYVNDFSTEAGSTFVALYEFNDFSNPKIMKVSNAAMIPSTIPEEETTTTNHNVKGLLTETRVSGGVTLVSGVYQTVFYSSYAVNIKSSTDPYDYLTTATCVSSTDGGTGTSTTSQTYTKQDKINTVVSSIVERGNQGKIDEYLLFRSTGTTTVPVNTADWTGLVDITYATSTSGTVISGVLTTNIAGATERKYESLLYSRRDSFRLTVSDYVTTSGIITEDTDLYMWGFTNRLLDLDCQNSVVFEITNGEAYNCRLTAWDDVTHSTTKNELIQGDHVRCSAMVYCCTGSKLVPAESKEPLNLVYPPVHNRIFKGNTIDGTNKLFYGDFDMVYRYQSTVYGDFLIFKPLLYGIDENISYGIHDYLITFHYSYT